MSQPLVKALFAATALAISLTAIAQNEKAGKLRVVGDYKSGAAWREFLL